MLGPLEGMEVSQEEMMGSTYRWVGSFLRF